MLEYFRTIGKKRIVCVDIGANDPVIHSNTYLFYREGSTGLLVDANEASASALAQPSGHATPCTSAESHAHNGPTAQAVDNGP